ncbi:hypothetical protein BEP19_09165 [Ammoniphilus oxalaticus]|uniref:Uncharacterized protein n=1 Tax=Ammoniphilus oxalaticus TaxID=66863 RepID=A0A419SKP2_9BACL|nr:hypothetical protein BEP19_09165 [Ammoniphilus oxalaticus]
MKRNRISCQLLFTFFSNFSLACFIEVNVPLYFGNIFYMPCLDGSIPRLFDYIIENLFLMFTSFSSTDFRCGALRFLYFPLYFFLFGFNVFFKTVKIHFSQEIQLLTAQTNSISLSDIRFLS